MTNYGYDSETGNLVAVWHTPDGPVARTICADRSVEVPEMLGLARELTELSRHAWQTFTEPATAAGNPDVVNSEAWRRQDSRESFAEALRAVRNPNLPSGSMLVRSYVAVVEVANGVGRILHAIKSTALTEAVAAEAELELGAVELAELGNLSGRAAQAAGLSRASASPLQVDAASTELNKNLMGTSLRAFEPSAAAVAAALWLRAAAEVAGEASDTDWTEVVDRSDDIQALPTEAPTAVLERMQADESAADIVSELVGEALAVAAGVHPDPDALLLAVEALEVLEEMDDSQELAVSQTVRLTLLDPQRPAVDLLEDLLSGVLGCYMWWSAYAEFPDDEDDDVDEDDDDADLALESARQEEFIEKVRAQMAASASPS